ncbi:MAG TPA: class I SAM-dependent methyltransferase [Candidatus Acidoferrales bacterium]|nr:class I SAM-dependent methyltransferase [Candidatus Acidoferrales bacterium]
MPDDRQRWEARYAHAHGAGREAPSEFVVMHADRLRGRILDIAAGAGRNALFLARRGNLVEAIDISLAGLRLAQAAARAEGLRLTAVQADLESFPLPVERYDAVINIRYLQRSLFVPTQRALKPGGVVLVETFLIDQQRIGHPRNPDFLLQRGELRAAFSHFELLVYEEGLLPSAPQPAYLARLLARRPPHRVD